MSNDAAKADQIAYRIYTKLALVVSDARAPPAPPAHPPAIGPGATTPAKVDKWFNLETQDVDTFKDSLRAYRSLSSYGPSTSSTSSTPSTTSSLTSSEASSSRTRPTPIPAPTAGPSSPSVHGPGLPQPFHLDVLLSVPDLAPNQVLVVRPSGVSSSSTTGPPGGTATAGSSTGPSAGRMRLEPTPQAVLLERWTLTFTPHDTRHHPQTSSTSSYASSTASSLFSGPTATTTNNAATAAAAAAAVSPPTMYKHGIPLFRSVYTLLRVLPAWSLARKLRRRNAAARVGTLGVRVAVSLGGAAGSTGPGVLGFDSPPAPSHSPLPYTTRTFPPLPHPSGMLVLTLTHLTAPPVSGPGPGGGPSANPTGLGELDFAIDDAESLLSSRFLSLDAGPEFTPTLARPGQRSTNTASGGSGYGFPTTSAQQQQGTRSRTSLPGSPPSATGMAAATIADRFILPATPGPNAVASNTSNLVGQQQQAQGPPQSHRRTTSLTSQHNTSPRPSPRTRPVALPSIPGGSTLPSSPGLPSAGAGAGLPALPALSSTPTKSPGLGAGPLPAGGYGAMGMGGSPGGASLVSNSSRTSGGVGGGVGVGVRDRRESFGVALGGTSAAPFLTSPGGMSGGPTTSTVSTPGVGVGTTTGSGSNPGVGTTGGASGGAAGGAGTTAGVPIRRPALNPFKSGALGSGSPSMSSPLRAGVPPLPLPLGAMGTGAGAMRSEPVLPLGSASSATGGASAGAGASIPFGLGKSPSSLSPRMVPIPLPGSAGSGAGPSSLGDRRSIISEGSGGSGGGAGGSIGGGGMGGGTSSSPNIPTRKRYSSTFANRPAIISAASSTSAGAGGAASPIATSSGAGPGSPKEGERGRERLEDDDLHAFVEDIDARMPLRAHSHASSSMPGGRGHRRGSSLGGVASGERKPLGYVEVASGTGSEDAGLGGMRPSRISEVTEASTTSASTSSPTSPLASPATSRSASRTRSGLPGLPSSSGSGLPSSLPRTSSPLSGGPSYIRAGGGSSTLPPSAASALTSASGSAHGSRADTAPATASSTGGQPMLTRANDVDARLREMQEAFMASLAGLGSGTGSGSGSAAGVGAGAGGVGMPGASLGRASSLGAGRRGSSSALPRHMHVRDASPSPSLGAGSGAGSVSGSVVGSTTASAMGSALGSTAASTVGSGAGSRTGSGMGSGMGSTSSGEVLGRLELSEKDRAA